MTERTVANDLIAAGRAALGRFAWEEARITFEAAIAEEPRGEAYEGLARAASWLEDERGTIDNFEQAYRLFQAEGDAPGAARAAIALAVASVEFRGEAAVANGWL